MKSDIIANLNAVGDLDELNENDSSEQPIKAIPFKPRMIKYDDEIIEILHEWEPEYENFTSVVANLLHSPFDIEDVRTLIHEWYDQRKHTNDNTIDTYIDAAIFFFINILILN